ncbi:MAG: zinc-dependent alcohol dehydrogenase family protein [Wenzhouxiangellaceae bacterium]
MRAMMLETIGPADRKGGALRAVELPRPTPGVGEVLIEVEACGVCHTELDQIEGRVPTPLPRIPGHQVIGHIRAVSDEVDPALTGSRVGLGWIASACGTCRWCEQGLENLCPHFRATGCDRDGGYAEWMTADAAFCVPVPEHADAAALAPLLCAGAIGLRSLRLAGLNDDGRLGLIGFGASNHLVLRLVRRWMRAARVFVWARDPGQRRLALELGAHWAGEIGTPCPEAPDAFIDTTPVWTPVLSALSQLAPGGRLVINAIAKQDADRDRLAELDYPQQLWREKQIRSVANLTRRDLSDFLDLAVQYRIRPEYQVLPLHAANEALVRLAQGGVRGALVLDPGAR